MGAAILRLPLFILIIGVFALSMLVPAGYAVSLEHFTVARSFLYGAILTLAGLSLVALAALGRERDQTTLSQLLALFGTFTVLPVILAVPFYEGVGNTSFLNAYFEMVSSITTTGATLFEEPDRLSPALHLWRAQVAWLGGLIMWIAAAAVFTILSLGGFEVTAQGGPRTAEIQPGQIAVIDPARRWVRATLALVPIYALLTLALWVMLMVLGEARLEALVHAMSVMSTSGISAANGMPGNGAGIPGEIVVFLFMFFALARATFSADTGAVKRDSVMEDPELRLGLLLVFGATVLLFLRHWLGSYEVNEQENLPAALSSIWGALFTVMSFLTTTGFESAQWNEAQSWSGLGTPGLILMGLSLMGGGVATTAGGVKLLRVFALYLQGLREMEKLVHPSSVSGATTHSRRIRRQGAVIAWVFFMLFAMSLALVVLVLTICGVDFEPAMVMSVASLSTTGPLIELASESTINLLTHSNWVKGTLCAAMVLGRLETLAIIALLSPGLWRK